jgi:hypothetical protein
MYLPPEVHQPFLERKAEQDDIFAIGVIWYQLLLEKLERPPYDFAEQLRDHGVTSGTIRLIERCLAQPRHRFAHAGELKQTMESRLIVDRLPVPEDCVDVGPLVLEYLDSQAQ